VVIPSQPREAGGTRVERHVDGVAAEPGVNCGRSEPDQEGDQEAVGGEQVGLDPPKAELTGPLAECAEEGRSDSAALPAVLHQHADVGDALPIDGQTGQTDAGAPVPGTEHLLASIVGEELRDVANPVGDPVKAPISCLGGASAEQFGDRLGVATVQAVDPQACLSIPCAGCV